MRQKAAVSATVPCHENLSARLKGKVHFAMHVTRLFVLALGLVPITAIAQAANEAPRQASKPPAVAPTPERTTASFGDWVLRCEAAVTPAQRVCEVAQVITLQGQTSPTAQVAL